MGVIARPRPLAQVPWRLIAVAAALLILAAGMLAYVGSRTTRVPAPFGPAANGQMFFHDADGVIFAADPTTGLTTPVVTGSTAYAYPLPSRDGRYIAFDHTAGGVSQLFIADADGSGVRPLPGTYQDWNWSEWSPDGRELGIVARHEARQTLHVLAVDGSASTPVPIDRDVLTFYWLPDGGFVFTGAERPDDVCRPHSPANRCALFVTGPDGMDARMVLSAADFSGLSTSLSPDGKTVLYDRWVDGEPGRLYIVDLASGVSHQVPFDNLAPEENSNIAELSPDGSQILFDRFEATGDHWAVIPTAGGSAVNIGIEWPDGREGVGPEAHWAPDGRTVTAFYPGSDASQDQLWMLDVTGQGDDHQIDLPTTYLPAWQRVAP